MAPNDMGTVRIIQADSRNLPLPDNSVDLVVTSPPYLNLRAYQDGGQTYDGQIGVETTPEEFIDNLVVVTAECVRVLKPSGSIFVNLGDAYSGGRRLDNEFTAQDAAWLAGVIDSDGSISVRVDNKGRSHVAWVRVGQMKPEVVQRIGQVTGTGQVWQDKRGVWNWNAAAQQARWVLERVWPYLYIKRRQALAAIELMSTKEAGGRKGKWNMLTEDDLARRERIRQAVLAWNRGDEDGYAPPEVPTVDLPTSPRWLPQKSLMGIPWRYALRCIDDLGLILRAEVIWSKPNGLPESVTDRVRRSHEQWFHFVLSPRYYSAVDEIREPHIGGSTGLAATFARPRPSHDLVPGQGFTQHRADREAVPAANPLGKLPSSVWNIPANGESLERCVLSATLAGAITIDEGERILKGAATWTGSNDSGKRSTGPAIAGSGLPGERLRDTASSGSAVRPCSHIASPTPSSTGQSPTDSISTTSAASGTASDTSSPSPSAKTSCADRPPSPLSTPPRPTAAMGTSSPTTTPTAPLTEAACAECACETATAAPTGGSEPPPSGPGSVWTVPTEPLRVPDHLGVDHFAAFPTEWPKRIIRGWSPAGVCVECGEGRRTVVRAQRTLDGEPVDLGGWARGGVQEVTAGVGNWRFSTERTVTGYACACPEPTAPTTPGVVLDCFGGTGTTAMVAKALGRDGISVDMSADYCQLAEWRCNDRDQLAKVLGIEKAEPVSPDEQSLLDLIEGGAA